MKRQPPQSIESENLVLGSCLLIEEAIDTAGRILQPNYFYNQAHVIIFAAMVNLTDNSDPVDVISLKNLLQTDGSLEKVGGLTYLTQLSDLIPTLASLEYHCERIKKCFVLRNTLKNLISGVESCYTFSESNLDFALEEAEKAILAISQHRNNSDTSLASILPEVNQEIQNRHNGTSQVGVKSGLQDLDILTGGFKPGQLIVLAARPAMGKSGVAGNICLNVAKQGTGVALISLEMSREELTERQLSSESGIDLKRLSNGNIRDNEWPRFAKAKSVLEKLPIFLDDSSRTLQEIKSLARQLKRKHNIGLLVVDYLQLIESSRPRDIREQEVSEFSRGLKGLARELRIPIIALSQLNRGVEGRNNKRPMLYDLRESGAIEQDADIVCFLYRDEYYRETPENKGLAELIISKQRNGPTATVELVFKKEIVTFKGALKLHQKVA